MAELKLEGMDELLSKLQQIGEKASRVENKALRAGAEILQKAASDKAPKSGRMKPHLKENIQMSNVKMKDGIKIIEVGPTRGSNDKFFYGKFLEFGTSKMSARPYLYPAMVETKGQVQNAMRSVIKGALGI